MSTRNPGAAEMRAAGEWIPGDESRRADGTRRSRRRRKIYFGRRTRWRDLGPNLLAIAGMMVVIASVIMVVEGLSDLNLAPALDTSLILSIPSDLRR